MSAAPSDFRAQRRGRLVHHALVCLRAERKAKGPLNAESAAEALRPLGLTVERDESVLIVCEQDEPLASFDPNDFDPNGEFLRVSGSPSPRARPVGTTVLRNPSVRGRTRWRWSSWLFAVAVLLDPAVPAATVAPRAPAARLVGALELPRRLVAIRTVTRSRQG